MVQFTFLQHERRFVRRAVLSVICGALGAIGSPDSMAVQTCDKMPVHSVRTQVIGVDMRVNGYPTTILALDFSGNASDVSAEFQRFWDAQGVPAKSRTSDDGVMLAALDAHCHYVLTINQQQSAGTTKGLFSASLLEKQSGERAIPDNAVPMPANGTAITSVESSDADQAGRTWIVKLPSASGSAATDYQRDLTAAGWSTVAITPSDRTADTQQPAVTTLAMQRGKATLDAVFTDNADVPRAVIQITRNR